MKPVSEMTNEEIDTELALKMGWRAGKYLGMNHWLNENGEKTGYCPEWSVVGTWWHPTQSLDQCHVVEEEKMNGNEMMYLDNLDEVLLRQYGEAPMKQQISFYYATHATARQKAEALLMTLREVEK